MHTCVFKPRPTKEAQCRGLNPNKLELLCERLAAAERARKGILGDAHE